MRLSFRKAVEPGDGAATGLASMVKDGCDLVRMKRRRVSEGMDSPRKGERGERNGRERERESGRERIGPERFRLVGSHDHPTPFSLLCDTFVALYLCALRR